MDLGLTGVHVLVTGASGGIGLEATRLYLEQGARVTAHYNTTSSTLHPLLSKYGLDKIHAIQANLTIEEDTEQLLSNASRVFGTVQVIVINHGIFPKEDEMVWQMSLARWKNTIDANLTSSFLVAKEYLKRLENSEEHIKDKASVVFIGSTAGKYGEAGHADYAASKSAMMYGLTLSLKNEIVKIAPKGRVNAIGPGWVYTPMAEESLKDPKIFYKALATTPLKKVAQPHDIATQIVLLSSQTVSGHISGQVLMIEGGMEGRLLNKPEEIEGGAL
ncbi:NAD-P-binding protein [Crucibulum laeve]|uniref:NAD-P-binding protein n=1 Tax=Crucibulum laeve TaxID=68775 RepID=A0A5C3LY90_9AGAR|nr:NAD-P-binding protein [Crucibulum laeve]